MCAQEDSSRRKEFQKRTDEDIDSFLARKEFSKTAQPSQAAQQQKAGPEPATEKKLETRKEEAAETADLSDDEREEQIKAARLSRAQSEAYEDVVILRKKSHAFGHKAAKFYHKYKAHEAKAQKCQARAVAYREKSAERREKARGFREREKEYETELTGAAQGKSELSPESLRTRIATMEKKAAKQEEVGKKYEAKAAMQTAKAAKYRTRAAKFLEQNRVNETEAKRLARRADNLEKAGL